MIFDKIFFNLFYPWVCACFCVAYNNFQQSEIYNRLLDNGKSIREINKIFAQRHMDDFMNEAFREQWLKIIFLPWTFVCSREAFDVEGFEEE